MATPGLAGAVAAAALPGTSLPAQQAAAAVTAQEQPLYMGTSDPKFEILYNLVRVDQDTAGLIVDDVGSTLGKTAPYYNTQDTDNKLRFVLSGGSDYRMELSKFSLAFDYVFRCNDALDQDVDNTENTINPYAMFHLIKALSFKINDGGQSAETYESSSYFGDYAQARMELKYDAVTLDHLEETLFTPVHYTVAWSIGDIATAIRAASQTRSDTWATPDGKVGRKRIMFSDLFDICNIRAVSNNIRKVEIEIIIKKFDDPSLVGDITARQYPGRLAIKDARIIMHDTRLSPAQNMDAIQDKALQKTERFAYIVADCGRKTYTKTELPYMRVSNLALAIYRFPAYSLVATQINHADYDSNDISSYCIKYGTDQYPHTEFNWENEYEFAATPYFLLKKAAGKEGMVSHEFGIRMTQWPNKAMYAARFYDCTYPHLSVSKELKVRLNPSAATGGNCDVFYAHLRFKLALIGGDGSTVYQA